MAGKKRHSKNLVANLAAVLLLLVGAALLFAPLVQNAVSQAAMDGQINEVRQAYGSHSGGESPGDASDELSQTRQWLEQYNQKVAAGEISIAADPFSFSDAIGLFASQGIDDGLIGYIEIPKMSCSLPLYLGSSEAHMAKGATVVAGSSAPLGGSSSNCVIAAHRGYANAAMFRDIEKLAPGDEVRVCTLWEELTYVVVGSKVIDPSDVAAVSVRQGEDLVTLVTCHPYGYNTYRYAVECKRVDAASGVGVADGAGAADGADADGGEGAADVADAADGSGVSCGNAGPSAFDGLDSFLEKAMSLPEVEDFLRAVGGIILFLSAFVLALRAIKARRSESGGK